ncbi:hypothetical protein B0A49_13437 [Cryomyces minteri]|uniref:CENP-V/GFA domain-containing protein n=1 Tax=Cryomyces minteri TaxID=331657 RepID=A0A4U0V7J6_9PEZI|nr:hypothetical protein B0A49_13437 [Cryomyces minteri]
MDPPLKSHSAYKQYRSSPVATRGFCGDCGSALTFSWDSQPEQFEIWLGSLDEKWVIGDKVAGSEKETAHGTVFERRGGIIKELYGNAHNIFFENAIVGMTDKLPGKRFLTRSQDGDEL